MTLTDIYIKTEKDYADFLIKRDAIINQFVMDGGWATATDDDKYIVIDMFVFDPAFTREVNDSNKVAFLMSKGKTMNEAIEILSESYAAYHENEIASCQRRASSQQSTMIMVKYLNITDAADFVRRTDELMRLYTSQGIRGVNYGVAGEGIADFIMGTVGTSYEFVNLTTMGYVLKTGTITDLQNELIDALMNGNC